MRGRVGHLQRLFAAAIVVATAGVCAPAAADVTADRTAIRFVSPETGGAARPRFFTARQLAFFARLEALQEGAPITTADYPDRYVRTATDRLMARVMLASLLVQRGTDPLDLPKQVEELRAELADRVGGPGALADAMRKEGIGDDELAAFLRDQARAIYYIDRGLTPILAVTEDSLREAFRSAMHPYRNMKFDDARARLKRWVVGERARAAEIEFLQAARARIKVVVVPSPSPGER